MSILQTAMNRSADTEIFWKIKINRTVFFYFTQRIIRRSIIHRKGNKFTLYNVYGF